MITVEQAKSILLQNIPVLTEKVEVKIAEALGYRLAEDIYATLNLPPFDQSNVDGYAIRFASGQQIPASKQQFLAYKVIAEIKAGDSTNLKLEAGEAARIFTGAMVPEASDAIIMQEHITRNGNLITSNELLPKAGEQIRKEGAQIKEGELALDKGTLLNPSVIGFLAALSLQKVTVFKKPSVSLIITGNEFQESNTTNLAPGKIYESNSATLHSALISMGLTLNSIHFVKDDKKALEQTINDALPGADLLLISGGISVGEYDFVKEALMDNGITTLFHKIAQKPGKPLYFGKNKTTFVFGLPGNPASALTCFYQYVYPALRKMQGHSTLFLKTLQLQALKDISKKTGLAHFLKAQIKTDGVLPLQGQESFIMKSFAEAGAFLYLPKEKESVHAGEMVEVHLLPES